MAFIYVKTSRTSSRKDSFLPKEVAGTEKSFWLCLCLVTKTPRSMMSGSLTGLSSLGWEEKHCTSSTLKWLCCVFYDAHCVLALGSQVNLIHWKEEKVLTFVAEDKSTWGKLGSFVLNWEEDSRQATWKFHLLLMEASMPGPVSAQQDLLPPSEVTSHLQSQLAFWRTSWVQSAWLLQPWEGRHHQTLVLHAPGRAQAWAVPSSSALLLKMLETLIFS